MKFVKRILREFFALDSSKQFKWTIVIIVLIAAIFGVATREAKASERPEHLPDLVEGQREGDLFTRESQPDLYCLAQNIYYESRADNLSGKYAVADVVLNRVNDPRYPNTVCGVVEQAVMYESWTTAQHKDLSDEERIYYPKRNKCQFSWFCDGKPDTPNQMQSWKESQLIAYNIITFGRFRGITDGATHYHATYVTPHWSTAFDLKGQIGAHIFYQWALSRKTTKAVEIGTDGYDFVTPPEARIVEQ